jgi:hypothetical protein
MPTINITAGAIDTRTLIEPVRARAIKLQTPNKIAHTNKNVNIILSPLTISDSK